MPLEDESHAEGWRPPGRERRGGWLNLDDKIADGLERFAKFLDDVDAGRYEITVTVRRKP